MNSSRYYHKIELKCREFIQKVKKIRNFPIEPIVKIAYFGNVMSIDMTLQKLDDFYNGVYMGNFFLFRRIKLKFCSWLDI